MYSFSSDNICFAECGTESLRCRKLPYIYIVYRYTVLRCDYLPSTLTQSLRVLRPGIGIYCFVGILATVVFFNWTLTYVIYCLTYTSGFLCPGVRAELSASFTASFSQSLVLFFCLSSKKEHCACLVFSTTFLSTTFFRHLLQYCIISRGCEYVHNDQCVIIRHYIMFSSVATGVNFGTNLFWRMYASHKFYHHVKCKLLPFILVLAAPGVRSLDNSLKIQN